MTERALESRPGGKCGRALAGRVTVVEEEFRHSSIVPGIRRKIIGESP